MTTTGWIALAVVCGLVLGTLVLGLALGAARQGSIGWDVAQLAVLAPVAGGLLFGLIASAR